MARIAAVAVSVAALSLGACAVDSQIIYGNYIPAFLKQAAPTKTVEPPPNVPGILRSHMEAVFVPTSAPKNIRYSDPVPTLHGGWETCVKAHLLGANGKPLGERTYLVSIAHNEIGDRRSLDGDGDDRCAKETYQPLEVATVASSKQ
jgi:hypothetical protein